MKRERVWNVETSAHDENLVLISCLITRVRLLKKYFEQLIFSPSTSPFFLFASTQEMGGKSASTDICPFFTSASAISSMKSARAPAKKGDPPPHSHLEIVDLRNTLAI